MLEEELDLLLDFEECEDDLEELELDFDEEEEFTLLLELDDALLLLDEMLE